MDMFKLLERTKSRFALSTAGGNKSLRVLNWSGLRMTTSCANAQSLVYKILQRAEWVAACERGTYTGSVDDLRDGFIHLSSATQLSGTARKYFVGIPGLVIIAFRSEDLGSALTWERSRGGELFPHLYGSLETRHALWVRDLPLDPTGGVILPTDLEV